MSEQNENQSQKLIGVLAQYDDADALLEGGRKIHESGYEKLDAYSPFPVHGIDGAIGVKRTILPFICLFVGIGAAGGGIFLQWYANAWVNSPVFPGYDVLISGKPMWSLPANIPVGFEIIVLSSAFAAFFGMLALNKLPQLANPLHRIARFRRVTNDRFFISVDAADEKFDLETTKRDLLESGATDIDEIYEDQSDQKLPSFVRTAGVLIVFLLMIPPVMIYRAQGLTNRSPRLHVNPDMDFQTKFKAQSVGPNLNAGINKLEPNYVWSDIRSARDPIAGTIARDHLEDDSEFFRGIKAGTEEHVADQGVNAGDNAGQVMESQNMFVSLTTGSKQDPASGQLEGTQEPAATEEVKEPDWVSNFPARLAISEATLARGKKMFEINCVVCHGYAGHGDGLVNKRALELAATANAAWTEAKTLHHPEIIEQPVGRLFDTITHGRSTMGPYGQRLKVEDRWAIVLYIKALQATIIDSDEKFVPPVVEETPAVEGSQNGGDAVDASNNENNATGDGKASDDKNQDDELADDGPADNSKKDN